MSATYRTRTRPQHFQSSPAIDGRSPLTRLIDEISERFEHNIGRPKLGAVGASRDVYRWRRIQIQRTGGKCPKCLGKKWVLSHKYAHVDDFVDCPLCTPVNPGAGVDYPTADDVMEIPF